MASLTGAYGRDDKPSERLEPIPTGSYAAIIIDSDKSENSKNTGWVFTFTYSIVKGEYKGRKLKVFLNLIHENQTAQEISRSNFAAMRAAMKKTEVKDTSGLHNIVHTILVKCEADKEGKLRSNIIGWEPIEKDLSKQEVEEDDVPF